MSTETAEDGLDSPQLWLRKLYHELGNAVWAVSGYSEILQRAIKREEGGQFSRDLTSIARAAWRIQLLCQQMHLACACRFPEATSPGEPGEEGSANLAATYSRLRHAMLGQDPSLAPRLPKSAPALPLEAPAQLVGFALHELLANALEFTQGPVTLEAELRGSEIEIAVLDEGPKEDANLDWTQSWHQPFQGSAGRLGLGATMVSQLAQDLGGRLTRSPRPAPARGSRWCLTLPGGAAPGEVTEAPLPQPGSHSVLYIDDEPANRSLIRRALEARGWRVLLAATGADGLALARSEHPDLALLDLHMPGMDGFETSRRLRQQSFQGPILGFSASGRDETDLRQIEGTPTFDAFLDKSGRIEELHTALLGFLPGRPDLPDRPNTEPPPVAATPPSQETTGAPEEACGVPEAASGAREESPDRQALADFLRHLEAVQESSDEAFRRREAERLLTILEGLAPLLDELEGH